MSPAADHLATAPWAQRRPGMAVAVLALHVLLALALWQTLRWRSVSVSHEQAALVWVQPVATPPAARPPTITPAMPRPPAAAPTRPRSAEAAPVAPSSHESTWVSEAEPAPVAAAPAASAAPPGRLMDSEGTRAAIRQIGQQPLLQERAATGTQIPIARTDAGLARGVTEAGLPDCMKDPVPGGILGLPFLAARVASGKCAK